ncbi:MAG: transcription factor S [Thermoplasmatales archaeon]
MFCPKCGSMMMPKNGKWVCTNASCGYEMPIKKNESKKIIEKGKKRELIVVKKEEINLPLDKNAICPKCGNQGAYWEAAQTRAADEPETKFYICAKCGHRWREY